MSKPIPIQDSPCENQNSFNSAYNTALQKSENLCANQPQFNKALSTAVDNLPPELTLHSNVCKDQDTFNHSYAKAVCRAISHFMLNLPIIKKLYSLF